MGKSSWRGASPSAEAKSSLPLPWLVVVLLINELVRLGNLAAAHCAGLALSLHLRPSEALHLCREQVVPPVWVVGHPSAWSIPLHLQEQGMRIKVSVYDDSFLLDNPENKFLEPMLKKLRNQGEALLLLDLRCLVWTIAACSLRFERFGPPVLHQLGTRRRVARSFHRLSRRDGGAEKGAVGAASVGHVGTKRLLAFHNCSRCFLLENFDGQRRVAPNWLSCCRLVAERCPHHDRRNNTPLGLWRRIDGSAMESHSLMEYAHVSCVRAPVAGVSGCGPNSLATPRSRLDAVSLNWWPRTLHRWATFLQRASTAGCLCSLSSGSGPSSQRPRTRVWVLATPSRRTADHLRALRVRRPLPCFGGTARPQRIKRSSKQSLRRRTPSLPDRHAPVGASLLTVVHANLWNRSHKCSIIPCTTTLKKE